MNLRLRNGLAAGFLDLVPWGAAVMHVNRDAAGLSAAAGDNLGDVDGVVEEGAVVADGLDAGGVAGPHEMGGANEGVTGWAEVVTGVAITTDRGTRAAFWWQRGPADVVTALPPGHPGGCPFAAGDPKPTVRGQIHPAAIVVGGPPKGLTRLPRPPKRGPAPAAVDVGPPGAVAGEARLKTEAMAAHVDPPTMRGEAFIKDGVVSRSGWCCQRGRRGRGGGGEALGEGITLSAGGVGLGAELIVLLP